MRRLLPPTHLLRAFVTTARHGSITGAAAELHLTAGAVSRQVAELEQWIDIALFERIKKRLVLNTAGERYLARIRPLLEQVEAATLELRAGSSGASTLTLSIFPTFGANWLFPRLPEFQRSHPEIELRFMPYVQGYDFTDPALDCAIRWGAGVWPGAQAHYLIGRENLVVAPPPSPDFPALREPGDVRGFTLLHHVTFPQAWPAWCAEYRVHDINPLAGPRLELMSSLLSAVKSGMGLALVPRCLVDAEIASGAVTALLDAPHIGSSGYFCCYPEGKAAMPALQSFRQWLHANVPAGVP